MGSRNFNFDAHQATRAARLKLRTPLHQIVSYAELISEEERGDAMCGAVHTLRAVCNNILDQIRAGFDTAGITRKEDQESLCHVLLAECAPLRDVVASLRAMAGASNSDDLRRDVEKIAFAAKAFEEELEKGMLSRENEEQTSTDPARNQPIAPGQPSAESLIAKIEYKGLLLVVDDDEGNRDLLSRRLLRDGYEVMFAESGKHALRILRRYEFDLVLLDIMMPEMDGTAVLEEMKRQPAFSNIPIIMISAVDDIETIAHCIERGADDYLLKPFNAILLRARIAALFDRKRELDARERRRVELEEVLLENKHQREQAEKLLLNILPPLVAHELQECGSVRPMYFEDVSIVFADIAGFTRSAGMMPADELVEALNDYFTACDEIVSRYGLEKLKTIGDCYMFAGGIPERCPSHPIDSIMAALEMLRAMERLTASGRVDWQLRVGIHNGPVIAGVVGTHKFAFDIWGESVNLAKRIESAGAPGRINLSASSHARIKDFFACEQRGSVRIKEGKEFEMFFLAGVTQGLLEKPGLTARQAFAARYNAYFRKELRVFPEHIFPQPQTLADARETEAGCVLQKK